MEDYKAMYLKMFNATEDAMKILIDVQKECEEIFIRSDVPQPVDEDAVAAEAQYLEPCIDEDINN